jgi:hypothetical protein
MQRGTRKATEVVNRRALRRKDRAPRRGSDDRRHREDRRARLHRSAPDGSRHPWLTLVPRPSMTPSNNPLRPTRRGRREHRRGHTGVAARVHPLWPARRTTSSCETHWQRRKTVLSVARHRLGVESLGRFCSAWWHWCSPLITASIAYAQATRTWVSGVGNDANPCSRTALRKTFAGATSKTAVGGEINVLDPGSFGAVTIAKSDFNRG